MLQSAILNSLCYFHLILNGYMTLFLLIAQELIEGILEEIF